MSAFSSLFGIGRAILDAFHAQDLLFRPADESAPQETVRAKVGAVDVELLQGEADQTKQQRRFIEVPLDVSEHGPSERCRGGKYTIEGEVWTVHIEASRDNVTRMARLDLRRKIKIESGGRGDRVSGTLER